MALTIKDLEEIEKVVDERIEDRTNNLPTKDEFFTRMDQMMVELKAIRESQDILTNKVYNDHEPRIALVENKTEIGPSV